MNRKLELTKKKRLLAEQKRKEQQDATKANKELTNAIDRLYELINGQESYDFTKLEKQLEQIDKSLDLSKHFKNLERSIENNSPHKSTLKTKITDFSKLLDAVKKNKPIDQRVDISKLEKAVINIEQYIRDNSEPSDQGAENYQPFRRVIKTGNRFIFDDNYYNNGGGGAAVQESLISNDRVKVDVGTNINVGEVEVKNDSGNPVPISGTVTANLSATDNTVLDNIDSNTAPTTGLNTGRKVVTTAGTAVAIASSTTCKWVAITAETDNTGYIVVGDSGVIASLSTREGVPLNAGDSIVIPIDNLSDVYIDSTVSGEGVTFTYGT